jgi:hypothetical protein
MKEVLLYSFVGAALIVSVVALMGQEPPKIEVLGAASGPDHYNREFFYEAVTLGGKVTALGTLATTTLTGLQVCETGVFTVTGTASSGAVTLPSAANVFGQCLTINGQSRTLLIDNAGVATSSIQITAGASTTLVVNLAEAVTSDDINGGNLGLLHFVRVSATKLVVFVSELVDSD